VIAQQVVVNAYFNAVAPEDEWIELLVVTDNTNMNSWTIRDNNSTQTSFQTPVTFNNSTFWNNMRAGTIIMIWTRTNNSSGVAHPLDVNKDDGYVELSAQSASYFSGGAFGSGTLDIAGTGDIIELRNSSGTHIHALAHKSTVGADWTAMATPKLNHANNASSGDAIYVCPGAVISDYDGPATGNAFTSKNNSTITFGLPNTCGSSATGNTIFVDGLREPVIVSQSVVPSVSIPGDITFAWTAATDPNPSDNTIGYMILRNTSNTFTIPTDGVTYSVGGTIGSATVVAEINSSGTTSFTDNSVVAGNCYYYRVYAFRYTSDNMTGTAFVASTSRGRAYNQTNFVFVDCLIVLPIELLNFTASYTYKRTVELLWQTATETNNDFFTVERSIDAVRFESIANVDGAGNSSQMRNYSSVDDFPLNGISYYRLKQTDFNGMISYSAMVSISIDFLTNDVEQIYPNPTSEKLNIVFTKDTYIAFNIKIVNSMGQILFSENKNLDNIVSIDLQGFSKGIYFLIITADDYFYQNKIVRN